MAHIYFLKVISHSIYFNGKYIFFNRRPFGFFIIILERNLILGHPDEIMM